ncbi:MAG TPA: hypothetical protein VG815_01930 [Chloroflexota bacterium]|jgi:hypothetical protein|nr:hypothetical protein [Chloroflexota bacterium]
MTDHPDSQLSFETDIRPLFREEDQKAMDFAFDLWDFHDVRDNAPAILSEVEAGGMPCDGAWEQDKVELFRRWMDAGTPE